MSGAESDDTTARCDLCGRAMAVKTLTPNWYPHKACERASCRKAVGDAVAACERDRERNSELVWAIANRYDEDCPQAAPVAWRDDAMSSIDIDPEQSLGILGVAKGVL